MLVYQRVSHSLGMNFTQFMILWAESIRKLLEDLVFFNTAICQSGERSSRLVFQVPGLIFRGTTQRAIPNWFQRPFTGSKTQSISWVKPMASHFNCPDRINPLISSKSLFFYTLIFLKSTSICMYLATPKKIEKQWYHYSSSILQLSILFLGGLPNTSEKWSTFSSTPSRGMWWCAAWCLWGP